MKTYHFFSRTTGLFHHSQFRTTVESAAHLSANTPPDHVAIEGDFDALSQRVDVSKAQPQYDAHLAAHAERVNVARESHRSRVPGEEFREPPLPPFVATADVVVDYQPPQPSPDHEWNTDTKRWQVKPEVQAAQQRRATALAEIGRLESQQQRPLRELALGLAGARERLEAIDARIEALRGQVRE